jgi:Beta-propeller repeat
MRAYLVPCFAVSVLLAFVNPTVRASEIKPVSNPTRAVNLASLPVSFERCGGSGHASNTFCHRMPGSAVFLTPTDVSFIRMKDFSEGDGSAGEFETAMSIRLVGATRDAYAQPSDQLPGKSNYLTGRDPRRWQREVVQYARVAYRGVYPGIDVVYYGNNQQLESDFVVAPRASVSKIRMRFKGASNLTVDAKGDLVASAGARYLRLHKPRAHQQSAVGQVEVGVRYVLLPGGEAGVAVDSYDRATVLVIDPIIGFSTYFTGGVGQWIFALTLDDQGNIYAAGTTVSASLVTVKPFQAKMQGIDGFVVKLDPTASTVLYSTFFGGSGLNEIRGIAVDSQHDIYVTGDTDSQDFPLMNPIQSTIVMACPINPPTSPYQPPCRDAFVAKFDPSGSQLIYSTYLGGSADDVAQGIAADAEGSASVVGYTLSPNFPTSPNSSSTGDVFIARIGPSGDLLLATRFGGSGGAINIDNSPQPADSGSAIALDPAGNIYVTGYAASDDFPILNGIQSAKVPYPSRSAFVSKLTSNGTLTYSTFLGSSNPNNNTPTHYSLGSAIAIDGSGAMVVAGETNFADFSTKNASQSTIGDVLPNDFSSDAFVSKISPDGSQLIFSTFLGGAGMDSASGLAIDTLGNVAVTGMTQSTNFPTKEPIQAGSKLVLVKSTDQGATWQSTNAGLTGGDPISALIFDPSSPTQILAVDGYSGLYLSTDAGATWSSKWNKLAVFTSDGGSPPTLYAGVLGGGGFWRITGAGTVFTQAANVGVPTGFNFTSLACSHQTPGQVFGIGTWLVDYTHYALQGYGAYKSFNAGDNWIPVMVFPPVASVEQLLSIVVDPNSPNKVYMLGEVLDPLNPGLVISVFYQSSDGGATWTSQQVHNGAVAPLSIIAIDPTNSKVLYIAGGGGYFKTTDGGKTWTPGPNQSSLSWIWAFAINPANSSILYQSSTTPVSGLYRSGDGGASWNLTSIVNRLPSSITFDPSNPSSLFVGLGLADLASGRDGEGDAFVSLFDTNGGLIFSTYLGGTALDWGQAVAFTSTGDMVVGGYSSSGDFPTTSGSFQPVYSAGLVPQRYANSPCENGGYCPPAYFYHFPASGFITGYQKMGLEAQISSVTLPAGSSQDVTLSVLPRIGDMNTAIHFTCSGLPQGTSCTFSPSQVMPTGSKVAVVLTIRAGSSVSSDLARKRSPFALLMLIFLASVLSIDSAVLKRTSNYLRHGAFFLLFWGLLFVAFGCGGSKTTSNTVVTQGTYQVAVHAIWGSTQSSTNIALTIE